MLSLKILLGHYDVLHLEAGYIPGVVPVHWDHHLNKTQSRLFLLQLLLRFHIRIPLLNMCRVICRLRYWFYNQGESISRSSIPFYKDTLRGKFTRSNNGITSYIKQMMYSMLRRGYPTYSQMPNDESELWFRNFAESGHPATVHHGFHEKVAESYTKQICELK
ncbi:unnamed protein product [Eruca vesicaria subsp. sativa]|uniref:Uncharacterized protein n=1 Tax=Eruca vesicaria subsp. sativa TaxID=29727 RepID=A0ABC8K8U5_ERUVS|nr:unnamed protein product [Eruca vesicaria subsp. sativa]